MAISDIISIIGVIATIVFGLLALLGTSVKGNAHNTNIKGNKNKVSIDNFNIKHNSDNTEKYHNTGNSIYKSTVSGSVIIDGSRRETNHYYNGHKSSSADENGIWTVIILVLFGVGMALAAYIAFQNIIFRALQWISIIGLTVTLICAIKVYRDRNYAENPVIHAYSLFSIPGLFMGVLICTFFLKQSLYTPSHLKDFIKLFKKDGIFSYLSPNLKYKPESMYLLFQIASVIFMALIIILLFGALIHNLSIWKLETMGRRSSLYKMWKKIFSLKLFSYNIKVSIIYSIILLIIIFPFSSGIAAIFFK